MKRRILYFTLLFLIPSLLVGTFLFANENHENNHDRGGQEIPADIRNLVPESDWVEMFCYMIRWRAGHVLNVVEVAQAEMQQIQTKAAGLGIQFQLPDFLEAKTQIEAKFQAICSASNLEEAMLQMSAFRHFIEDLMAEKFESMRSVIEEQMKESGEEFRAKLEGEMASWIQQTQDQMMQEMIAERDRLIQEWLAQHPSPSEEEREAFQKQIDLTMEAKSQEIRNRYEKLFEGKLSRIMGSEEEGFKNKFEEFGKFMEKMGERMEKASGITSPQVLEFKAKAIAKRVEITLKIIEAKLAEHLAEFASRRQNLEELRRENPAIPSYEEILAQIEADKKVLVDELTRAIENDDEEAFEEAIEKFREKMEEKGESIERKIKNAKLICSMVLPKVAEARTQIQKAIDSLKEAKEKCKGASEAEICQKLERISEKIATFEVKLANILSRIDQSQSLCAQVGEDTPPGEIISFFNNLKDEGDKTKKLGEEIESELE